MNSFQSIRCGAVGLILLAVAHGASGAEFRIDEVRRLGARAEVSFAKEPAFYYILWRGDQPTDIRLATDLALGTVAPNSLADTNGTNAARFYRVEKVSLTSTRDTDGDGLCDAWELLHRHPGAAHNPNDANEDHDGNGVPDRIDALRENLRGGGVRGRPVVAAGANHSLAIKTDGTLWGWGDNLFGELGSTAFSETNSPTQIGAETNWRAVSIGGLTSYGLKLDGTLWVWGQIYEGNVFTPTQLGTNAHWIGLPRGRVGNNPTALRADGTRWQFVNSFTNAQPYGGSNDWAAVMDDQVSRSPLSHWAIKQDETLWNGLSVFDTNQVWSSISAGIFHALALRTNGTLWAWVYGCCANATDGQLGLGNAQPFAPTQVGSDTWAAVAAGLYHSVGIKNDGSLWWWGLNNGFAPSESGFIRTNVPARVGTNTDWLAVAADISHTVALRTDGTIWTFGLNQFGKLGNGTVPLLKQPTQVGADQDWKSIAIGTVFSFGVKSNGTMWAWGANPYGVLGVGDFASSFAPRQVLGSNWLAVSGGGDNTTALQSDGSLWIWGKYVRAVVDVFTNVPVRLGTDNDWKFISAGNRYALALKTNGSLWSWGRNSSGVLGTGGGDSSIPVQVGSAFWTNVSAGFQTSLGVQVSSLWSWGQDIRNNFPNATPQQVGVEFNWKSVAAAKYHSVFPHALALKRNGTLWSWGYNFAGQLGNGTNARVDDPAQVGVSTNWLTITAGSSFSGALQRDGSLWLWGENAFGQLGSGTRNNTNLASPTGTATDWTAVAAGNQHVLALKADGTLWAWGDNSYGQCAQPALFEAVPVAGTNWGRPQ